MKTATKSVLCFAVRAIGFLATSAAAGQRGLTGACCFPDASCVDNYDQADCESQGGIYFGDSSLCQNFDCLSYALGACCLPDGSCSSSEDIYYCEKILGGSWQGPLTLCGFASRGGGSCGGPVNDDCENAIHIYSLNVPEYGNCDNAHIDYIPNCEKGNDLEKYGVWYSVTGNGSVLRASVCGPVVPRGARGDRSVLFVYCGGCDNLHCVAGDGGRLLDCSERTLDPVVWCSVPGEEYLLFVALEGEGTTEFMLTVEDTGQPCKGLPCSPPNDDCEDAIMLRTSDGDVYGTTFHARFDDVPKCFENARGGPSGVWYKVVGTGNTLELDVCVYEQMARGERMFVGVYCGSCGNLNCVESRVGEEFYCDDLTERLGGYINWCSEAGRVYYILVATLDRDRDFLIRVRDTGEDECEPAPCGTEPSDFCENAPPICPGIPYTGDTFDATNDYLDHGAPINTVFFCNSLLALYDVWYAYTPAESGLLFVHVEQLPTEWVFGVYDDCPKYGGHLLNCNTTRHHGVIVVAVDAYHTYYIRIAGFLESRGEYIMDILGPPCADDEPYDTGHLTQ